MSTKSKRVLLFAGKLGYQTHSFDDAARKLGVELTLVTDRCHQLEDPWGDRAIPVPFETPQSAAYSVLQAVRERGENVEGILALGDQPAVAAAYVARGLGVGYNHPLAVEACRSKLRTREILRDAGLPGPWFRTIALQPPPEPALLGISYPCIVKPLSLSASQGVVRANNAQEFMAALERIGRLLVSPAVLARREAHLDLMVEGYIPGTEVAVEGLLTEGRLRVLAIFDKPDPLEGPFFEETIYVTPSRLPELVQRAVERCAEDAVRALGLTHGSVHAEFRVNEQGVWPLEMAARPIGGLCARALRFVSAESQGTIGLEELLLRHALGVRVEPWCREALASGVMMIPVPQSGVLKTVQGEEAARETPGISGLEITARVHDYIAAWPEGSTYLGFLFAQARTPEEVERALRLGHRKLKFVLTARLPVEHPATRRLVV